jgi:hypothetical protein
MAPQLIFLIIAIVSSDFTTTSHALSLRTQGITRRRWLSESVSATGIALFIPASHAIAADADGYENPNLPAAPEEKCEHFCLFV